MQEVVFPSSKWSFQSKEQAYKVKRMGVIFHHNNAHLHTTQLTKDLWEELSWEKLLHHLYSLDLAPSDNHLIRRLHKHLDDLRLTSRKEGEHELVSYFAQNLKNFTSVTFIRLLTNGMRFSEARNIMLMIKNFYL